MTAKVVQNARNDVNQAFEALNELSKDSLPHSAGPIMLCLQLKHGVIRSQFLCAVRDGKPIEIWA